MRKLTALFLSLLLLISMSAPAFADGELEDPRSPWSSSTRSTMCALFWSSTALLRPDAVINPGQDNEETQQHNVSHDVEAQFLAVEDYTIYADEAMTQAVDYFDTSAESATYYISVG